VTFARVLLDSKAPAGVKRPRLPRPAIATAEPEREDATVVVSLARVKTRPRRFVAYVIVLNRSPLPATRSERPLGLDDVLVPVRHGGEAGGAAGRRGRAERHRPG
jgi:hypothetical protein